VIVGLTGVALLTAANRLSVSNANDQEVYFDSPRMAALAKKLTAQEPKDRQTTVDDFWRKMQGKGPLIEPAADLPHYSWITFLWRGDGQTRRMNVQGGPATGDYAAVMTRLVGTDLWYRTDIIPNDSRFAYFFQVNRPLRFPPHSEKLPPLSPPQTDSLNPHKLSSDRSVVELPDAPHQPWFESHPKQPKGKFHQHKIESKFLAGSQPALETERQFMVYTPPKYDPHGEPCRLMIVFDGNGCQAAGDNPFPIPRLVDNLVNGKSIPPMVSVFVFQSRERDRELGCSDPFADFVAKELIPAVQKNYNVTKEPSQTIAVGMSAGGAMAAYCGYRHSQVVGNVLSLSGAFGFWPGSLDEKLDDEPGWLTREFVKSPRLPVRFYMAAGRFENWFFPYNLLTENRRFRDVLLAKGYDVQYSEFSGCHEPICWRGPFVDGLIALTATPYKKN
jgi:enterochelin esterase family protein